MSKLDELIQKLCPDGVEYKTLGDLCDICGRIGFRGYTSQDQVDKGCGAISMSPSNIQEGEVVYENCTYISWFKYDESPEIQVSVGDIIFCKTASVGKTALIKELPEKATINPQLVLLKNITCDSAFLSYILKTKELQNKVNKIKGLGTIPTISQKDFANLTVPVPPLEVQREIVRILDNFTELTAELTAELTTRKKQYEYYSSNLFPNIKDCENWIELGDVATVTKLAGFEFTKYVTYRDAGEIIALRGLNVKDGHLVLNDVKFIDGSNLEMLTRSKLRVGDMLFTYVGTVGQVALIDENDKYYLAPNVALVRITDARFLPGYVMHYFLTSKFKNEQIAKLLQTSSLPNIPMEKIRKFKLPVVDITEQRRIIDILERFDTLCNDISAGLPAEIEARQKQYEYYRDKLLTFKEVGT